MDFETIYKKYSPKIFRLCLGYFNDFDKARDLTQETFIGVWENLAKFEHRASIGTWIYRIATNKCLSEIQKEQRHPKAELPPNLKQEGINSQTDEQLALLHRYISELPEIDRIIISLSLEDVPQEEIAEIVGISHGNVRVRFYRIKEKLMTKFRAHGSV